MTFTEQPQGGATFSDLPEATRLKKYYSPVVFFEPETSQPRQRFATVSLVSTHFRYSRLLPNACDSCWSPSVDVVLKL